MFWRTESGVRDVMSDSPKRGLPCLPLWCGSPATFFRARNCAIWCGDLAQKLMTARSMCISADYAKRSAKPAAQVQSGRRGAQAISSWKRFRKFRDPRLEVRRSRNCIEIVEARTNGIIQGHSCCPHASINSVDGRTPKPPPDRSRHQNQAYLKGRTITCRHCYRGPALGLAI